SRSQQTYLYFEDGKGNTTTYKLKGVHPDIVLGDDRDRLGVDYRVAVTYIDPSGYPMLAFYKLIMLGTPSFTVVPLNVIQLSTNAAPGIYDTEPIPHIDMWSDANNPVNGYPGMYEFAVTWNEMGDVKYNWGNINAGSVYLPVGGQLIGKPPATLYGRAYTDVACYTNVYSGRKYATFSTVEPLAPFSCNLDAYTFDFTTGLPYWVSTNTFNTISVLFPRIEAMNQYDSVQCAVPWEIVYSGWGFAGAYNMVGNVNLTNALLPASNLKSIAIAAGVGHGYGDILGNLQYTPGYLYWGGTQHAVSYFAHAIDAYSGTQIDPNYYEINSGTVYGMPQYQEADASKSLALSNCSNSGDLLLSVWYDGEDVNGTGNIWYKLLGNTVPMQFRPSKFVSTITQAGRLYPNPATDRLNLTGAEGTYTIEDALGRTVQRGNLESGATIGIESLSSGFYLLRIGTERYKFTKF
ncbi:MAG: T9SS type A sorting domain-containing protein, partial [Bacteroidetes bacterium]|nr:T9SS type A sorting domain-containing protein [Bacteroidota bacterium]